MKQKFLFLTSCLMLVTLVFSNVVWADDAELVTLVKGMQKQMSSMQKTIDNQNQKIATLETRQPSSGFSAPSEPAAPMSDYEFNQRLESGLGGANKWLKDLSFKGDLRLRYEAFHYGSGHPSESDDRNRFRYRLRYGFEKKFSEDMKVGFSMASGEQQGGTTQGDPTSTNTTFDNNFAFKQINVEKAYASYSPSFLRKGMLKNTNITAGKMDNAFEKGSSDMVWDRDVKPEGIYEKMDFALIDSENFDLSAYATAGQFVLDEDATVGGDANLFAYQFGINPTFYTPLMDRPVDFLQAVSLYDFSNYARSSNFLLGTGTLARGNINSDGVTTELDAGKFKIFESYSEVTITPFGLPSKFFFDFAANPADSANTTVLHERYAFALGAKLGAILGKGDWEFGYAYKQIGANAVVGAFNDSDFGDGHAGKRGHVLKAAYALTDTISLNGAAFIVENLNSGTAGIIDQQQRRFQVDLVWKF